MSKLLYIGHTIEKPKTGGEIASANVQKILSGIFKNVFYRYDLNKAFSKRTLIDFLFFLYPGLKFVDFKKIRKSIAEIRPTYVFVETAQYGAIIK